MHFWYYAIAMCRKHEYMSQIPSPIYTYCTATALAESTREYPVQACSFCVQVSARVSIVVSRQWARVHSLFRGRGDDFDPLPHCSWLSIVHGCLPSTIGPSCCCFPYLEQSVGVSHAIYHVCTVCVETESVFRGRLKAFLYRRSFPWLTATVVTAQWQLLFSDTQILNRPFYLLTYLVTYWLACNYTIITPLSLLLLS